MTGTSGLSQALCSAYCVVGPNPAVNLSNCACAGTFLRRDVPLAHVQALGLGTCNHPCDRSQFLSLASREECAALGLTRHGQRTASDLRPQPPGGCVSPGP